MAKRLMSKISAISVAHEWKNFAKLVSFCKIHKWNGIFLVCFLGVNNLLLTFVPFNQHNT